MNKFDVIVVGGGIAGSATSVSAAREGQKVLLIEKAIMYAAKMMEGTAALMLQTNKHPETLIKEVCSPGGSTIKGVEYLMENGFENIVQNAVEASYNRTKELGK